MKKAFLKTLKDNDLKVTKNRLAILRIGKKRSSNNGRRYL